MVVWLDRAIQRMFLARNEARDLTRYSLSERRLRGGWSRETGRSVEVLDGSTSSPRLEDATEWELLFEVIVCYAGRVANSSPPPQCNIYVLSR